MFNIHLAKVYGFCRGVQGVTEKADRLLAENPDRPVYSIGKLDCSGFLSINGIYFLFHTLPLTS